MKSKLKDYIKDLSLKAQQSELNRPNQVQNDNLTIPFIGTPSIGTPSANSKCQIRRIKF